MPSAGGLHLDDRIKLARLGRDKAREFLARDIDPSVYRKAEKPSKRQWARNSFEAVVREWLAKHAPNGSMEHGHLRTAHGGLHHWLEDRVRAHVLLCMLVYYVEWHMQNDLAPLRFDDHDPEAAEAPRPPPVEPAWRSPAARQKAGRKQTDEGLPVHSFRSLIDHLGTLVTNTMDVAESGASFHLRTEPTPLQKRCFELLEVTPRMSTEINHPRRTQAPVKTGPAPQPNFLGLRGRRQDIRGEGAA